MKHNNAKLKIFPTILIFSFSFLVFSLSNAQSAPQFLTSWKADSYVPSWYGGKALPSAGSNIEISFNLIDGGKIVDLSKTKVRWYINDELTVNEESGLGIKTLKFKAPQEVVGEIEIKIVVIGYKETEIEKFITIPIEKVEVVIDSPRYDQKISREKNFFRGIPFFFNILKISNLSVKWIANERNPENIGVDPWRLDLNIDTQAPSGFEIDLKVEVHNVLNQLEFAGKNIKLQIR